jgi:hypothetical protein
MTVTADQPVELHELTEEEELKILDRQARRYLGMSGEHFIQAWNAGAFDDDPDRPEVMRLAMLLPVVR